MESEIWCDKIGHKFSPIRQNAGELHFPAGKSKLLPETVTFLETL